jgi:ABC-type oligopeptide transport system ATPase subunit
LLKELQTEFGLTYIFISHDLSVVKFMSDRAIVMNKGKIEEIGTAERIYRQPQQAYTRQTYSFYSSREFGANSATATRSPSCFACCGALAPIAC